MESLSRAPWGDLYSVDSRMDIVSIDPLTGLRAPIAPLSGLPVGEVPAIAFDRFGALWGIHRDATDSLFRVADITTGVAAIVGGTAASKVRGMAFATDGDLFGWDASLGLVEIDTHAGGVTPIGNSTAQIESIAFDGYGNLYGSSDQLYGISTTLGIATPIGTLSQPLHGIEFYSPRMVFSVDVQGPTAAGFRDPDHPPAPVDGFTGSEISGADLLTTSTLGPPGPNPPTPHLDDGGPPLPTPGTVMFAGAGNGETPGLNLELMPVGPTGELDLEIDAISFGRDHGTGFAFSVDEFSRGVPGGFEGRTVASEAMLHEAAADVFLYAGHIAPTGVGTSVGHRLLIDGNGSSAHGLGLHEADITPTSTLPDPTDNLDAFDLDTRASDLEGPVYFSLDAGFDDPNEDPGVNLGSAAFQTGNFSGADILVRKPDGTIEVYATAAQLGLDPTLDDVNALILHEDGDGFFDPARDWLMFSVRRGSAVIGTLDDRLGFPIFPSDLLGPPVREGKPPVTITTHDTIVLDQDDDIDGLDNVTSHPNRLAGDMTYDDFIDLDDEFAFALGLANIDAYRAQYVFPPGARGNFDSDPEFDFDDVPGFLAVLEMVMSNPPAARVPEPASCVLLGMGSLMLQRYHRHRRMVKTRRLDSGGVGGRVWKRSCSRLGAPQSELATNLANEHFPKRTWGATKRKQPLQHPRPPNPPGTNCEAFPRTPTKSPDKLP